MFFVWLACYCLVRKENLDVSTKAGTTLTIHAHMLHNPQKSYACFHQANETAGSDFFLQL